MSARNNPRKSSIVSRFKSLWPGEDHRSRRIQEHSSSFSSPLTRKDLQRLNRRDFSWNALSKEIQSSIRDCLAGVNDDAAVVSLRGSDAQQALQLMQALIDNDDLWATWIQQSPHLDRRKLPRIMMRLSHQSGELPESLYVSVKDVDQDPKRGGGHADIYGGTLHGHKVALKRLRYFSNMTREETQQTSKIQDFARESLLWLQLQHENVVHLLGIDVERFPGMPCMVLPWMESGNIRNYMEKKTFPVVQLNQWLREVAEGLTYLHDEQVVHGDLRGTNILMSEDGVAKLADFGLSVFAGERSKSFHSLRGGSERWMAPELLDPEAMNLISTRPTLASDVYSFGIVCVEIYTCEKPFHAHTNDNHVRKIVGAGGRPEKPSDPLKAIMDDDLFDLVCSCWQHQPSDRPPISTVLQQLRDRA